MYTLVLDYSKRHCWELKDGQYQVDGSDIFEPEYCLDYKQHLTEAGQTEFLRWIREFGILAPGIVTGFDDGWLKLGPDLVSDTGESIYCENYGDRVKAFLNVDRGRAIVEIDDDLVEAAREARTIVDEQYIKMQEG